VDSLDGTAEQGAEKVGQVMDFGWRSAKKRSGYRLWVAQRKKAVRLSTLGGAALSALR